MREVVLDTETTGLDPLRGDRIVEIGCVELINHVATERTFHAYINPERPMSADAAAVHGLTDDKLRDKPVFAAVVDDFLGFIADAPLVIHNAAFDIRFLNAELSRLKMTTLPAERAIDTLEMARRKFPGASASLDALCKRYGVDASERTLHGALLDSQLLAEVYLELIGGRQPGLSLAQAETGTELRTAPRVARPARPHAPTEAEAAAHQALIDRLPNPIWRQ